MAAGSDVIGSARVAVRTIISVSDRLQRTNKYTAEPPSKRYRQCLFEWLAAHASLWNQLNYRRRQEYFADDGDVSSELSYAEGVIYEMKRTVNTVRLDDLGVDVDELRGQSQ